MGTGWGLGRLAARCVGVFEGCEAIRRFFSDWRGAYEDFGQVIEEFRDLGNGVTLAVILQNPV
jgi:hypothetical protein